MSNNSESVISIMEARIRPAYDQEYGIPSTEPEGMMNRLIFILGLLVMSLSATGGVIVLKNGKKIVCKGPYEIKGQIVRYYDENDNLFQLPLKIVDLEKSTMKDPIKKKAVNPDDVFRRQEANRKRREEQELMRAVNNDNLFRDRTNPEKQADKISRGDDSLGSDFQCRQFLGYVRMQNMPNLKRMLKEKTPFEGPAYNKGNLQQPLHVATYDGNMDIVVLLLNAGANPNQTDRSGETALMKSFRQGTAVHLEIAGLLMNKGADPTVRSRAFITPLDIAIEKQSAEMVRILGKNVNVNQKDKSGRYPIFRAMEAKDSETVKALLEHKIDRDLTSTRGHSIVMEGVLSGSADIVRLLEEKGFSLDIKDEKGRTPFNMAMNTSDFDLASYLMASKRVDPQSIPGLLLDYVKDGAVDHVAFLLERGADPNTRMSGDDPILILAARNGNFDMVKLLADKGADVHVKGVAGLTADKLATGPRKGRIERFLRQRQSKTKK